VRTPELLSDPAFHDEEAARVYLEGVRWPDGPYCPFCGSLETVKPLGGPSMGRGWYYCSACQDKFTVRVGSIFERSHIPIHKWLLAFRLMASSKKGVSAHQIHRTLGITYKSAWFLMHRIREAMTNTDPTPLGGEGKTVEADETFYGYREGGPKWILHPQFGWQRDRGSAQRMTIRFVSVALVSHQLAFGVGVPENNGSQSAGLQILCRDRSRRASALNERDDR
jgi:transposase-like protein